MQHTFLKSHSSVKSAIAVLLVAGALSACGDKKAPAAAPPEPTVGVITVQPSTLTLGNDLPARLEPSREAEILSRVSGVVLKRTFAEGSEVNAGQSLYQIDSTAYLANLQAARASLEKAQASLALASSNVARYRPLAAAEAISKQELDNAVAQQRLAQAEVSAAKAAIQTAQLNVNYSRVLAPISGTIGRSYVTEGALVGESGPTKLAVIQQIDPLYVNITQSAQEVMALRKKIADGALQTVDGQPSVKILMEDGTPYDLPGKLIFTDLTVDETTGQVNVRAEVPNPNKSLLPGLYVRVILDQSQLPNAILLPQQSVTRSAKGDSVLVVNADGSFAPRPVTVLQAQGSNWIISSGLKAGEKVIVDGVMAVGMTGAKKVKTTPWQAPNTAKPAASAAPATQPAQDKPASAEAASDAKEG